MNRSRTWKLTIVALALAPLAGCAAPPKPVPPPTPPPAFTVPADRRAAVSRLSDVLRAYDAGVGQMPGTNGADHRRLAAPALDDLAKALRLAYGPNPSPGFGDDVAVVTDAHLTVADDTVPRGRMEGVETQALHAAAAALGEVATRVLFDDPQMPALVDVAMAKADAARLSQGPQHDGDATDAFRALSVALHRAADDLHERFAGPTRPMASPTTAPPPPMASMKMPTSPPATMPATTPATMP